MVIRQKKHLLSSMFVAGFVALTSAASAAELNAAYVSGTLDGMVPQIGVGEGIFRKHGLEVGLIAVKTGAELVSSVVSGAANFSAPSPLITIPAIEKGGDIKFLMNNYDLDYSLLAKPGVGIDRKASYPENVKPLKGLRIGVVGRGGLSELFARKIFSDAGLDPDKDLNVIAVGAGVTALTAFQNDQIDALTTLPPNDVIMKPEEYLTVVDNQTARQKVFSPGFVATALVTSGEMVKSSPNTVKSFCEAWADTIKFMREPANKAKVISYFSKSLNLKDDQAVAVFERYGGNYNSKLTTERWDAVRALRPNAPEWNTGVYAPCAEVGSK